MKGNRNAESAFGADGNKSASDIGAGALIAMADLRDERDEHALRHQSREEAVRVENRNAGQREKMNRSEAKREIESDQLRVPVELVKRMRSQIPSQSPPRRSACGMADRCRPMRAISSMANRVLNEETKG